MKIYNKMKKVLLIILLFNNQNLLLAQKQLIEGKIEFHYQLMGYNPGSIEKSSIPNKEIWYFKKDKSRIDITSDYETKSFYYDRIKDEQYTVIKNGDEKIAMKGGDNFYNKLL